MCWSWRVYNEQSTEPQEETWQYHRKGMVMLTWKSRFYTRFNCKVPARWVTSHFSQCFPSGNQWCTLFSKQLPWGSGIQVIVPRQIKNDLWYEHICKHKDPNKSATPQVSLHKIWIIILIIIHAYLNTYCKIQFIPMKRPEKIKCVTLENP